ncbi:MAG: hypothetical protein R2724_35155 [Bryobacterales bacterium]
MNSAYGYVVYAESLSIVNGQTISVWDDHASPAATSGWRLLGEPVYLRTILGPEVYDIPFDTNTAMQAVATRSLGMSELRTADGHQLRLLRRRLLRRGRDDPGHQRELALETKVAHETEACHLQAARRVDQAELRLQRGRERVRWRQQAQNKHAVVIRGGSRVLRWRGWRTRAVGVGVERTGDADLRLRSDLCFPTST